MPNRAVVRVGAAGLIAALLGCSAGDLTLPGQGQPASVQPAVLIVESGDGQRAEAGTVLDDPLTVRVLDDSSRAVPNTPVQFRFLGDLPGAELAPASVLTDAEGRASAVARLGEPAGEQVIVAEVGNTQLPDLSVRFSATAVNPHGKDDEKKGGG
jgi:hypothetical protein